MSRPVIGIMGNYYLINDQYPAHAAGTMNCEAIVDLCDATSNHTRRSKFCSR